MNTMRRRALMELAVAKIKARGTPAGRRVYMPRDVPTGDTEYPCVLAYTPHELKEGIMPGGVPEFNTTVMLTLVCRTAGNSADVAEDVADELAAAVEDALLLDSEFVRAVQQFKSVETQVTVNGENERHLGEATLTFALEIFQDYDPAYEIEDRLEGVNLYLDAISPADATGTYTNAPFPAAVKPAPRTEGPDGRAEGALQINFPTEG